MYRCRDPVFPQETFASPMRTHQTVTDAHAQTMSERYLDTWQDEKHLETRFHSIARTVYVLLQQCNQLSKTFTEQRTSSDDTQWHVSCTHMAVRSAPFFFFYSSLVSFLDSVCLFRSFKIGFWLFYRQTSMCKLWRIMWAANIPHPPTSTCSLGHLMGLRQQILSTLYTSHHRFQNSSCYLQKSSNNTSGWGESLVMKLGNATFTQIDLSLGAKIIT